MKFFRSGIRTSTTPDMKRLNIALMAGGDSSEREIALQSAAQIASALDPAKYDITLIDLHGRDWHYTSPDGRQWQVDKNDFSITIDGDHLYYQAYKVEGGTSALVDSFAISKS